MLAALELRDLHINANIIYSSCKIFSVHTLESLVFIFRTITKAGRTHNGPPFKIDFSLHIDGTHFEFKSFIIFIRTIGDGWIANKFFFDSNHIIPMNFFFFFRSLYWWL